MTAQCFIRDLSEIPAGSSAAQPLMNRVPWPRTAQLRTNDFQPTPEHLRLDRLGWIVGESTPIPIFHDADLRRDHQAPFHGGFSDSHGLALSNGLGGHARVKPPLPKPMDFGRQSRMRPGLVSVCAEIKQPQWVIVWMIAIAKCRSMDRT